NLPNTKDILIKIMDQGLPFTTEHLELVCKCSSISTLDMIIQKSRLPITKNHFQAVLKSHGNSDAAVLLQKYGYNVDEDDVAIAIKHGIKLDINTDIKLNDNLLRLCYEYNVFPDKLLTQIDPVKKEL